MVQGWLRIKDAAKYCGVSPRTLRSWLKAGLRHSRLPSGTILIKAEWIDQFLEAFVVDNQVVDRTVDDIMESFR